MLLGLASVTTRSLAIIEAYKTQAVSSVKIQRFWRMRNFRLYVKRAKNALRIIGKHVVPYAVRLRKVRKHRAVNLIKRFLMTNKKDFVELMLQFRQKVVSCLHHET